MGGDRSGRTGRAAAVGVLTVLVRGHLGRLLGGIGLGALTELAGPALLATSAWLIVRAAEQPPVLHLMVAIVGVRAFALLRATGRYAERLTTHEAAFRGLADLRVRLYRRLVPLVPGRLGGRSDGEVLATVTRDVDELQRLLVAGLVPLAAAPVAAGAVVAAAWLLDPAVARVIAAGLVVAGVAVPALAWRASRAAAAAGSASRLALHDAAVEAVTAVEELHLHGAVAAARQRVADAGRASAAAERRTAVTRAHADAVGTLVAGVTTAVVAWLAHGHVLAGVTAGRAHAPLVLLAWSAFEVVLPLATAAQRLDLAWRAARHLAATVPASAPATGPSTPPPPSGVREVRLVGARAARPPLHGVDLTLRRGEVVALVGPSGAGKSSVIRALAGLVDLDAGRVTVDGREVPHVRDLLAVAGQDAHLFPSTIAANLLLGKRDADAAEVAAVLDTAQLDEWVDRLPDGLRTHVGVGGLTVSGGQRRRIALARALLADRPFLVLDEPTADLDPVTAAALLGAVLAAAGDRGVLVVSHDLRVPPLADRVVLLDGGRVVACGTHRELLAASPAYRTAWTLRTSAVTSARGAGPRCP